MRALFSGAHRFFMGQINKENGIFPKTKMQFVFVTSFWSVLLIFICCYIGSHKSVKRRHLGTCPFSGADRPYTGKKQNKENIIFPKNEDEIDFATNFCACPMT